ncbi:unnamed protein product [Urochloa decumbens]|uniref:Bifunctional inhibitor/plant lipid transfer protein/seed storage helical domain-containing protein n=1 Tax=Urochloa decumbens TaxID=240449 RepID=A0ABC9FHH2_9POAL
MAAAGWILLLGTVVAVAAVALFPSLRCAGATAAGSSSKLDCGTVTSLLAGCRAFVRRGETPSTSPPSALPAPGAACCEGVAELYAVAADSADNWRSVCGCMAALVRRYSSNASAIAMLPVLCAVLPPAGGRGAVVGGVTLTYCTSSP